MSSSIASSLGTVSSGMTIPATLFIKVRSAASGIEWTPRIVPEFGTTLTEGQADTMNDYLEWIRGTSRWPEPDVYGTSLITSVASVDEVKRITSRYVEHGWIGNGGQSECRPPEYE